MGQETVGDLSEDAIIEIFARGGPAPSGAIWIPNGDDAAAYAPTPGRAQVLTTDVLTEGVHFDRSYTPARSIGWKLMAVNLSDVASMGAEPKYALLSAVLPPHLPVEWLREVAVGIHDAASRWGVVIVGGNVSSSPQALVLDAMLVGEGEPERLVRRTGSRPGDDLWLTGQLGGPAAALSRLSAFGPPLPLESDYVLFTELIEPQPRVAFGRALAVGGLVRAMCDVSDGLARDLGHLLSEGQGCRVWAAALPAAPPLYETARRLGVDPMRWIIGGGEEYELLFSADPVHRSAIVQLALSAGCPLSRIGQIERPGPRQLELTDGTLTGLTGGWDHFHGEPDAT